GIATDGEWDGAFLGARTGFDVIADPGRDAQLVGRRIRNVMNSPRARATVAGMAVLRVPVRAAMPAVKMRQVAMASSAVPHSMPTSGAGGWRMAVMAGEDPPRPAIKPLSRAGCPLCAAISGLSGLFARRRAIIEPFSVDSHPHGRSTDNDPATEAMARS